jgi:hypothetical protein
MAVKLTDSERAVLAKFVELEAADPEGAWNYFHHEILAAAGDAGPAAAICADLRRRKLLKGEGRGQFTSYYPTDKGKETIAAQGV